MPTFKKSKGKKGLFTEAQLQLALKSTLEDKASIRAAAIEFGVPKSTLSDYVKRLKMSGSKSVSKLSMTTKQVAQCLLHGLHVGNSFIVCQC